MNGPQHYREAERLADQVAEHMAALLESGGELSDADVLRLEQRAHTAAVVAQVHATLALADTQMPTGRPVDPTTGGELQTIGRPR